MLKCSFSQFSESRTKWSRGCLNMCDKLGVRYVCLHGGYCLHSSTRENPVRMGTRTVCRAGIRQRATTCTSRTITFQNSGNVRWIVHSTTDRRKNYVAIRRTLYADHAFTGKHYVRPTSFVFVSITLLIRTDCNSHCTSLRGSPTLYAKIKDPNLVQQSNSSPKITLLLRRSQDGTLLGLNLPWTVWAHAHL